VERDQIRTSSPLPVLPRREPFSVAGAGLVLSPFNRRAGLRPRECHGMLFLPGTGVFIPFARTGFNSAAASTEVVAVHSPYTRKVWPARHQSFTGEKSSLPASGSGPDKPEDRTSNKPGDKWLKRYARYAV
jgi:hypothetical protein